MARIHSGNTSRKSTCGTYWEACAAQELEELLDAEWPAFTGDEGAVAASRNRPLVSCIIPTCNRRSFLPLVLEAFRTQDYVNKELIIVEDGEESSSTLVRGLESVRYLRLERCVSIGGKRNLACQAARGSIIAHWDDDDWCCPLRLRHQVAPLLAGQAEVTGLENSCQLELDTGEFWRTKPELHRKMFVGDVHGGTLVYWKRLFDQGLRYPEINLAEDAIFLRQAMQRGARLLRLDNPGLFVYVRHNRNSWKFRNVHVCESHDWEKVESPAGFTSRLLSAYREAATRRAANSASTSST